MADDGKQSDELSAEDVRLLAAGLTPREPPGQARARMKSAILQAIGEPATPGGYTVLADQGAWIAFLNGIEIKLLAYDREAGTQTALWRCGPGAAVPAHTHRNAEWGYLIEGDILFGALELQAGDYFSMEAGTAHVAATTRGGCLLLMTGDLLEGLLAAPGP